MANATLAAVDRALLERRLAERGEPAYRVAQVWDALYRAARPLEDATALPRALRDRLADAVPLSLHPVHTLTSNDGTTKWLWACGRDGEP